MKRLQSQQDAVSRITRAVQAKAQLPRSRFSTLAEEGPQLAPPRQGHAGRQQQDQPSRQQGQPQRLHQSLQQQVHGVEEEQLPANTPADAPADISAGSGGPRTTAPVLPLPDPLVFDGQGVWTDSRIINPTQQVEDKAREFIAWLQQTGQGVPHVGKDLCRMMAATSPPVLVPVGNWILSRIANIHADGITDLLSTHHRQQAQRLLLLQQQQQQRASAPPPQRQQLAPMLAGSALADADAPLTEGGVRASRIGFSQRAVGRFQLATLCAERQVAAAKVRGSGADQHCHDSGAVGSGALQEPGASPVSAAVTRAVEPAGAAAANRSAPAVAGVGAASAGGAPADSHCAAANSLHQEQPAPGEQDSPAPAEDVAPLVWQRRKRGRGPRAALSFHAVEHDDAEQQVQEQALVCAGGQHTRCMRPAGGVCSSMQGLPGSPAGGMRQPASDGTTGQQHQQEEQEQQLRQQQLLEGAWHDQAGRVAQQLAVQPGQHQEAGDVQDQLRGENEGEDEIGEQVLLLSEDGGLASEDGGLGQWEEEVATSSINDNEDSIEEEGDVQEQEEEEPGDAAAVQAPEPLEWDGRGDWTIWCPRHPAYKVVARASEYIRYLEHTGQPLPYNGAALCQQMITCIPHVLIPTGKFAGSRKKLEVPGLLAPWLDSKIKAAHYRARQLLAQEQAPPVQLRNRQQQLQLQSDSSLRAESSAAELRVGGAGVAAEGRHAGLGGLQARASNMSAAAPGRSAAAASVGRAGDRAAWGQLGRRIRGRQHPHQPLPRQAHAVPGAPAHAVPIAAPADSADSGITPRGAPAAGCDMAGAAALLKQAFAPAAPAPLAARRDAWVLLRHAFVTPRAAARRAARRAAARRAARRAAAAAAAAAAGAAAGDDNDKVSFASKDPTGSSTIAPTVELSAPQEQPCRSDAFTPQLPTSATTVVLEPTGTCSSQIQPTVAYSSELQTTVALSSEVQDTVAFSGEATPTAVSSGVTPSEVSPTFILGGDVTESVSPTVALGGKDSETASPTGVLGGEVSDAVSPTAILGGEVNESVSPTAACNGEPVLLPVHAAGADAKKAGHRAPARRDEALHDTVSSRPASQVQQPAQGQQQRVAGAESQQPQQQPAPSPQHHDADQQEEEQRTATQQQEEAQLPACEPPQLPQPPQRRDEHPQLPANVQHHPMLRPQPATSAVHTSLQLPPQPPMEQPPVELPQQSVDAAARPIRSRPGGKQSSVQSMVQQQQQTPSCSRGQKQPSAQLSQQESHQQPASCARRGPRGPRGPGRKRPAAQPKRAVQHQKQPAGESMQQQQPVEQSRQDGGGVEEHLQDSVNQGMQLLKGLEGQLCLLHQLEPATQPLLKSQAQQKQHAAQHKGDLAAASLASPTTPAGAARACRPAAAPRPATPSSMPARLGCLDAVAIGLLSPATQHLMSQLEVQVLQCNQAVLDMRQQQEHAAQQLAGRDVQEEPTTAVGTGRGERTAGPEQPVAAPDDRLHAGMQQHLQEEDAGKTATGRGGHPAVPEHPTAAAAERQPPAQIPPPPSAASRTASERLELPMRELHAGVQQRLQECPSSSTAAGAGPHFAQLGGKSGASHVNEVSSVQPLTAGNHLLLPAASPGNRVAPAAPTAPLMPPAAPPAALESPTAPAAALAKHSVPSAATAAVLVPSAAASAPAITALKRRLTQEQSGTDAPQDKQDVGHVDDPATAAMPEQGEAVQAQPKKQKQHHEQPAVALRQQQEEQCGEVFLHRGPVEQQCHHVSQGPHCILPCEIEGGNLQEREAGKTGPGPGGYPAVPEHPTAAAARRQAPALHPPPPPEASETASEQLGTSMCELNACVQQHLHESIASSTGDVAGLHAAQLAGKRDSSHVAPTVKPLPGAAPVGVKPLAADSPLLLPTAPAGKKQRAAPAAPTPVLPPAAALVPPAATAAVLVPPAAPAAVLMPPAAPAAITALKRRLADAQGGTDAPQGKPGDDHTDARATAAMPEQGEAVQGQPKKQKQQREQASQQHPEEQRQQYEKVFLHTAEQKQQCRHVAQGQNRWLPRQLQGRQRRSQQAHPGATRRVAGDGTAAIAAARPQQLRGSTPQAPAAGGVAQHTGVCSGDVQLPAAPGSPLMGAAAAAAVAMAAAPLADSELLLAPAEPALLQDATPSGHGLHKNGLPVPRLMQQQASGLVSAPAAAPAGRPALLLDDRVAGAGGPVPPHALAPSPPPALSEPLQPPGSLGMQSARGPEVGSKGTLHNRPLGDSRGQHGLDLARAPAEAAGANNVAVVHAAQATPAGPAGSLAALLAGAAAGGAAAVGAWQGHSSHSIPNPGQTMASIPAVQQPIPTQNTAAAVSRPASSSEQATSPAAAVPQAPAPYWVAQAGAVHPPGVARHAPGLVQAEIALNSAAEVVAGQLVQHAITGQMPLGHVAYSTVRTRQGQLEQLRQLGLPPALNKYYVTRCARLLVLRLQQAGQAGVWLPTLIAQATGVPTTGQAGSAAFMAAAMTCAMRYVITCAVDTQVATWAGASHPIFLAPRLWAFLGVQ